MDTRIARWRKEETAESPDDENDVKELVLSK